MVIANRDIFERLRYFVADRRQVVEFELWLSQQYVEVQQSEILVPIDNPAEEKVKNNVSNLVKKNRLPTLNYKPRD